MQWLLVPAGYLLGSVSFGLLVVRKFRDLDLRETGSGNPGATNALRSAGRGPALAVLTLDVAKGAIPILLGTRLGAAGAVLGATALATVLGHMYPVFHGMRGGKGVATAAGALGTIQPWFLLASGVVFIALLLATRYVSLASILGVAAYPVAAAWATANGRLPADQGWILVTGVAIALLVVWRHRSNLRRLCAGNERRLGAGGTR